MVGGRPKDAASVRFPTSGVGDDEGALSARHIAGDAWGPAGVSPRSAQDAGAGGRPDRQDPRLEAGPGRVVALDGGS